MSVYNVLHKTAPPPPPKLTKVFKTTVSGTEGDKGTRHLHSRFAKHAMRRYWKVVHNVIVVRVLKNMGSEGQTSERFTAVLKFQTLFQPLSSSFLDAYTYSHGKTHLLIGCPQPIVFHVK